MTSRSSPPDLNLELNFWNARLERIAGMDEAGRGALAGPVVAAAVILPPVPSLVQAFAGVRDSKQMTPRQRDAWAPRIREAAVGWGVGFASSQEIDAWGIVAATRLAAGRAFKSLPFIPDALLLDFRLGLPENPLPQVELVKGDQRSLSIAAASVLAKTARDARMRELEVKYPGYGFAQHKGYGTRLHREAIWRMGRCEIHRKTFSMVTTPVPVAGRANAERFW